MNYRKFGKLNCDISEICLGTWAIGGGWGEQAEEESLATLKAAFDCGINWIDTAIVYGDGRSEKLIGQFISTLESNEKSKIKVATKIPPIPGYWPPLSFEDCRERYPEKYLRESTEASLERLGVDKIDLMQFHTWTRSWNKKPECFQYLRKMQEEGLIAAVGVSTPEQDQNAVNQLIKEGWVDSVQVIYNIFDQEAASELLDLAYDHEVGVLVRCALDEGSLTGKFSERTQFSKGDWRKNFFRGDRLKEVVKRVHKIEKDLSLCASTSENLADTALRFALSHPAVSSVICGARNPDQITRNAQASRGDMLDPEVLKILQKHAWRRYFWS